MEIDKDVIDRKRPKLAAEPSLLREWVQESMCPLVFVVDT